jgi:hypothetical protein
MMFGTQLAVISGLIVAALGCLIMYYLRVCCSRIQLFDPINYDQTWFNIPIRPYPATEIRDANRRVID